ncbi:hypothetical protein HanXRQr2_Chr03g0105101 [Helianthus annuus]|uniref:Uncharacterized protein n=1 Tax=Helianthus annuus TaxID=4232 RepID=A0A9K3JG21_HELAN|nr:hypothetical protein HanXRQr2_Chr03g0105101 [Helianthus annuus]KAJ0943228.1 hypothetical protein HanPSC8_Chr03g0101611 [Helianthus annuus]
MGSSEKSSQGSSSKMGFSLFPSFDPHFTTTKSGKVLQCNIALNLENDQNYSEEVAKSHMSLLVTVLESYGSLVAGRIGNPMLTKEDYDQVDAEEMELMDIKWCMARVLRRAEKFKQITRRDDFRDANVSTLVHQRFKESVSDDEKLPEGFNWENFSWDKFCPDKERLKAKVVVAQVINDYTDDYWAEKIRKRLSGEAEKKKEVEEEVKVRVVKEIPELEIKTDADADKVSEKCMNCDSLIKQNNELLHNIKRLKESYDVLNKEMNKYNESSSEQVVAMNTLKGAYMRQLDNVNYYTEKCAELELKLETQRIETERVNSLLKSYSCSTFVVDRIYPIVKELNTFEEEKTSEEKKSETRENDEVKTSGKKPSVVYNKCLPPVENAHSPRNTNSERVKKATNLQWEFESTDNLLESIDVTFTSSDTDHESELIKKVVDQVLEKDETEELMSESKSESKSKSDTSSQKVKQGKWVYNKEFLLSKSNLNDEPVKVAYTLKDSDKLYSDEIFPIRGVKSEMIKKVFKLTEIDFF